MDVFNIASIADSTQKPIEIPFISPKLMVGLFFFKAGQERPMHASPDSDAFIYLVKGRVEMHVGDEVREVGAGELVLAPANVPNGFKCLEQTVAVGGAAPAPDGWKKTL
jgi:quercetin dioxygenase-like cupin family protein